MVMQIGAIIPLSHELASLGFNYANKIKILGMEIDQNLENLDSNYLAVEQKIRKAKAYWERYNLSLPGKINIVKSLIISLLNHLGCILMPSTEKLSSIQSILDNFVLGKLNVAKTG